MKTPVVGGVVLETPSSLLHANHSVIHQCIPNAPVRVMERLIRSMAPGTMAILALEDGYLDVRDPARTGGIAVTCVRLDSLGLLF